MNSEHKSDSVNLALSSRKKKPVSERMNKNLQEMACERRKVNGGR